MRRSGKQLSQNDVSKMDAMRSLSSAKRGVLPVEGNASIEIELDATATKKSKHPNQKLVFRLLLPLPPSSPNRPDVYERERCESCVER